MATDSRFKREFASLTPDVGDLMVGQLTDCRTLVGADAIAPMPFQLGPEACLITLFREGRKWVEGGQGGNQSGNAPARARVLAPEVCAGCESATALGYWPLRQGAHEMRRPRLTYANVTATLALVISLGGVSYAAT
jgi:hypothetical protein